MPSYQSVFALAVGWLAAAGIIAFLLLDARQSALERAERASDAVTQVLEENTARTFQSIDLALLAVGELVQLTPGLRRNDLEFGRMLKERARELPYVRSLFVVGADGTVTHSTEHGRAPQGPRAGRPYLTAYRNEPKLVRWIDPPRESHPGLGRPVVVSRRVGPAEAPFQGIVVAAVQPTGFEALYRRMNLTKWEVFALYHRDGTLIARYPADDASVGTSFAQMELFSRLLPMRESGRYQTSDRLVGYRAVEGLPLVVSFSQDSATVLEDWRKTAAATALAMAALTFVLGFLMVDRFRRRWRGEQERERRAQAEKLEAIGMLTGGIAHDFGNLLSIISTNLHVVTMQPPDAERNAAAVAMARRALTRGGELIGRLLAFAKRQPVSLQAANLNALVREARGLLEQAAGPRIEIVVEAAPALAACLADKAQLEVALINLVVNARQAMEDKGRIVLRTYDAGDYVGLAVQDNGPGMSDKIRRRAFEPFFTTRGEAGTGLGLSQVYGFMGQIGGSARIDSAPGAGTTVHLSFAKVAARQAAV